MLMRPTRSRRSNGAQPTRRLQVERWNAVPWAALGGDQFGRRDCRRGDSCSAHRETADRADPSAAGCVGPIVASGCSAIAGDRPTGTLLSSSAAARKNRTFSANRSAPIRAASRSATVRARFVDAGTPIAAGGQF